MNDFIADNSVCKLSQNFRFMIEVFFSKPTVQFAKTVKKV